MSASRYILLAIAVTLGAAAPARCASVVGMVSDTDGKYVNGVNIIAIDASGKEAGKATTDLYGRYCLGPLTPGNYRMKLEPGSTGVLAGNGAIALQAEGETVDWVASVKAAAIATGASGVASPATAVCGLAWARTAALAAAGVGVVGGGTAAALLGPGDEGGPNKGTPPPMTGSK
jgi:hypothetical protein